MAKCLQAKRRKVVAEMNVVPYVDVMLVLLVIFMTTAPLLVQGVKVDLPEASSQPLSQHDMQPLILSIDKKGAYYLNIASDPTQSLSPRQVKIQVTKALAVAHARPVLVNGDKAANYGQVVAAMVLLQEAGVPTVGLMTQNRG
jgi:biopolymer transport protein TolR